MKTARHYVVLDGNNQPMAGGFTDRGDAVRFARLFGAAEVWLPGEAELIWAAYDDDTCHCGEPMNGHASDPTHSPTSRNTQPRLNEDFWESLNRE